MSGPVTFRCICPVLNCPNEKLIYWKHKGCINGSETIDINGEVRCDQCGTHDFILNWRYSCGEHKNGYDYPDRAKVAKVIGALVNMLDDDAEIAFITKLCKNIKSRNK